MLFREYIFGQSIFGVSEEHSYQENGISSEYPATEKVLPVSAISLRSLIL